MKTTGTETRQDADSDTQYRIWCRVSGGVTGTREAWLKANGIIVGFDERVEAETEAKRLNATMNGPHRTADFRYEVVAPRFPLDAE